MDHLKILKRAVNITWIYRALWVFGIIIAITASSGSGSNWNMGSGPRGAGSRPGNGKLPFNMPDIPQEVWAGLIAAAVGLVCVMMLIYLAAIVGRYVSETALIKLVDTYEETGEQKTVRHGFAIGWSRPAWRLFLIDLLIGIPVALAFMVLIALALSPLLLWITGSKAAGAIGTVAAIGFMVVVIVVIIVVAAGLSLVKQFFSRVCVLEETGVVDSVKQGWIMVKANFKNVGVMWLIMAGLGLMWAVAMIVMVVLLLALGVVIGGGLGVLAGGLAGRSAEGVMPWLVGGLVGVPVFLLIVMIPSLVIGGVYEVFKANVWTLVYRELRLPAAIEAPEPPVDEEPQSPVDPANLVDSLSA